MIDTIGMNFSGEYWRKNIDTLNNIGRHTGTKKKVTSEISKRKEIITNWGQYKGFVISRNFSTSFTGSICKYFHNNNFETLTAANFKSAIEQLSDETKLDFFRATISRLDLGVNLKMCFHPLQYSDCIKSYRNFERINYEYGGVWFRGHKHTKSKILRIYPKILQAQQSKETIPESFQHQNLLRFEVSWINHVRRIPFISTVKSLCNIDGYSKLIDLWEDEFLNKVRYAESSQVKVNYPANLRRAERNELRLIEKCGSISLALEEEKLALRIGKITPAEYRTAVRIINRLSPLYCEHDTSLKQELLVKVKRVTEEHKSYLL